MTATLTQPTTNYDNVIEIHAQLISHSTEYYKIVMFILEFTLLEGQQKGDQHKIFIFNLELHVEYLYFATW